jgi:hypothetical protein
LEVSHQVTGLRTKFSHNPNVGRKTEKRSLYTDKKCKFPHDPNVERKTKKGVCTRTTETRRASLKAFKLSRFGTPRIE